jgi:predicted lactoylglutathione lyase
VTVPARVNLVTLGVTDVGASTAFYTGLGWRRSSASNEQVTFLDAGATVVALFGRDDLADDAGTAVGEPGGSGAVALAINLDSPAAVDAAAASWVAAGGHLVKPPAQVFWGGYSGYVADPDGHLWEFAHNPYFPLREDGSVELP